MMTPYFRKTPIALAITTLLVTGALDVQADSPNSWGRWARGGGHEGGHEGHGWLSIIVQMPTSDEAIEELLAQLETEGLTDPPPGHWAFYGAEGSWDTTGWPYYYIPLEYLRGNTATGTLVLTTGDPSLPGWYWGAAEGGTIALDAVDSDGNPVVMNFPPGYTEVGETDGYGGFIDPFTPFYGEGPDGWIDGFGGEKEPAITIGEFFGSEGFIGSEGFGWGIFVAGQPTPLADMAVLAGFVEPVVGMYWGESWALGYGLALGVDFSAGTWGGNFWGGEGFDFNASGAFAGTAAVSDRITSFDEGITAIDGSVKYSFMGQDAGVIGGNFDVTAEFYGGSYYERVTDVFTATGEELVPRTKLPGPIDEIVHESPGLEFEEIIM